MKIVTLIARLLLGLIFFVFGANKLAPFIPTGTMPAGVAGQVLGALVSTKYFAVIGTFEALSGLLLLANRFVPLALTVLAAIIVNILLVGILMAPQGLGMGIFVALLWLLLSYRNRSAFAGLFRQREAA